MLEGFFRHRNELLLLDNSLLFAHHPPMDSELLSVTECAQRHGVSRAAILAAISAGRLQALRVGTVWAIPAAEADRYQPLKDPAARGQRSGEERRKLSLGEPYGRTTRDHGARRWRSQNSRQVQGYGVEWGPEAISYGSLRPRQRQEWLDIEAAYEAAGLSAALGARFLRCWGFAAARALLQSYQPEAPWETLPHWEQDKLTRALQDRIKAIANGEP